MSSSKNDPEQPNLLLTAIESLQFLERKIRHSRREEPEPFLFFEFAETNRELAARLNIDQFKTITPTERVALTERWESLKRTQDWSSLTRGDIRDLISIPEAFTDGMLFELIQEKRPLNKRLLTAILRSYVNYWQSLGTLRQKWQDLITEALEQEDLINLSWPAFQHWRKIVPWLISSHPETTMAQNLASISGDFSEAVKNCLQLDVTVQPESLPGMARLLMLDNLLQADRDEFSNRLDQALNHWVLPNADYTWLGLLIIRVNTFRNEELIERVKNWFLKADGFGDLRLNPGGEWRLIGPEAKGVFNSWLSKEDLEFFFKMILPERDDPQKRREFWEQYLPCVLRSRILISAEDKWRNQDILNEMKAKGKTLPGDCKNSSVFIMETKHCYILEFSETGNAAYIYWKTDRKQYPDYFELTENLLKFLPIKGLNTSHLRVGTKIPMLSGSDSCLKDYTIRVKHNESFTSAPPAWHATCRSWLNFRGIRP